MQRVVADDRRRLAACGGIERSPSHPRRQRSRADRSASDLGKLDLLLNLVGELVIRNSILAERPVARRSPSASSCLELARLTRQIQDNAMSLRAQPIKPGVQPRAAHAARPFRSRPASDPLETRWRDAPKSTRA